MKNLLRQSFVNVIIAIFSCLTGSSIAIELHINEGSVLLKRDSLSPAILIFSTNADFIGKTSFSPNGRHIAFLETTRGTWQKNGHEFETLPKNNMVICDTLGNLLCNTHENVRKFSWGPDGSQIAFISGTYYEGGVGFNTTGVFILDIESGAVTPINKDFPHPTLDRYRGGGYDINWSSHDSMVYIREFDYMGGNYRYDPKKNITEKIPYKGIRFSPDGKYYLTVNSEDYNGLYETETNDNITERVIKSIGTIPYSWLADHDHHLMIAIPEYELLNGDPIPEKSPGIYAKSQLREIKRTVMIYDVEKDSIVEEKIIIPE